MTYPRRVLSIYAALFTVFGLCILSGCSINWDVSGDSLTINNIPDTLQPEGNDNGFFDLPSKHSFYGSSVARKTIVEITPAVQLVEANQMFSILVLVTPSEPLAGLQFSLKFDPSLITCQEVIEGTLFRDHFSYFNGGIIDNINGTIKNVVGLAITGETNLTGIFANITFTAISHPGSSFLNLTDVLVGNRDAKPIPVVVVDGDVTIGQYTTCDVNEDGKVDIFDLILIGQYWGQTGIPGWIRADANRDGIVDIFDMIAVGQHWTG